MFEFLIENLSKEIPAGSQAKLVADFSRLKG